VENRGRMCRPVLDAAERGVIEIVVSAIALLEVLAPNRTSGIEDQESAIFSIMITFCWSMSIRTSETLRDD
jgi:hypothetical protein